MTETLYRKYRPQHFSDVVNQQHIRITLEHALAHERVAHAYLFTGPRGVGKTTMARILARAVNCTNRKKAEPCDECPQCLAILRGTSLDVVEIDAASQTGVDNVRENIIQSARSIPSMGSMKVFIIDEVHMLSLAAFNALLKLLEEPPAHAMFILATTEVHRIPETIISRTQRFDFKKISLGDMVTRVNELARREERELGDGVAERIARQARGSLRDAESMLGQMLTFREDRITDDLADIILPRSDDEILFAILEAVVHRQTPVALQQFHRYCDDGGDIPELSHQLVSISRAVLLSAVDPTLISEIAAEHDEATIKRLSELSQRESVQFFTVMVEEFVQAERAVARAPLPELPIEVAIIKISVTSGTASSLGSLPQRSQPTPATPAPSGSPRPKRKSAAGSLPLKALQEAWQKSRARLSNGQPGLALSLKQGEAAAWDDPVLRIEVPFQLHAERLMDMKNKPLIERDLSEALGQSIQIDVVHNPSLERVLPPAQESSAPPATPRESQAPVKTPPQPGKPMTSGNDLWDQVVSSFS